MGTTIIQTQWTPLTKARLVNQTSATFVAKTWQAAEPTKDANSATGQTSIDMRNGGGVTQNGLKIMPIGVGSDNNTFSLRVYAWEYYNSGANPDSGIWVSSLLLEALCTIDVTLVGLAGKALGTTDVGVDTITLVGTSGNANISHELVSPADGVSQAHIIVDTKGADKIEITFSTGRRASS